MFRIDKVTNSTPFVKNFKRASKHAAKSNVALCITQKSGPFLVVVDSDFLAGLLVAHETQTRLWGNHADNVVE
jgi:hypothetical protein